ncbi:hypothetical protein GCM10009760_55760 [Kitasatospora kazusensis]|uniref:Uncharacterized protein n=1 Tax=Kitasatospora kazusensis TaxID=407974 RepID=A0ABN3A7R7_9ACTN
MPTGRREVEREQIGLLPGYAGPTDRRVAPVDVQGFLGPAGLAQVLAQGVEGGEPGEAALYSE